MVLTARPAKRSRASGGCKICAHPERALIESWLSDAKPPRQIALRTNLSRRAIKNHLYFCKSLDEINGKVAVIGEEKGDE